MNNKNSFMRNISGCLNKTYLLVMAAILFTAGTVSAQVINEGFEEAIWQNFGTGSGASTFGSVTLPNVPTSSTMSYLTLAGASNFTTALNTCNNSGTWFFSKATSQSSTKLGAGAHSISHSVKLSAGGYIITPLTPAAVVNITFWASGTGGAMLAALNTDPNAGPPGYNTSTSSAPGGFSFATSTYMGTNTMSSFSFGGTYSAPCRFGIFNSSGNTIYVDDIEVFQPTGNPPTVATVSATAGITNAAVTGTVTIGATPALPLLASGIIWSTTPLAGTIADTLLPKTKDIPAATGTYTDAAGPLQPGTLYYTEAYVIGLDGSFYVGSVLQFTTLALAPPIVITGAVTSVLSYQATAGGSIPDSGGCTIVKKGVVWSTTVNPVVGTPNQTIDGMYGATYTSIMKPLLPGQLYHYRAYAINSCFPNSVIYGADSTFTTLAAVPSLTTIPSSINFGNEFINNPPITLSYILKGYDLNAGDSVIIKAPVGYTISLSASGPFKSSIAYHYPGNTFSKPVYVQLSTSNFGTYTGQITHTGGGAVAPNVDVENVTGTIIQSPAQLSNMGTDFWAGFGCEEHMSNATTQFDTASGSANGAHFSLYIATGSQAANVVVDLPGLPGSVSFPRTITIPANSVTEVGGFPIGDGTPSNPSGAPDCRLYSTGVSRRGIHVTSTNGVPVACWLYDWATNNSAAGAMLFPTNTWNSSYAVQAYGGTTSNTGIPSSYFFVIANDDNTVLTITPTADIIDAASSPVITKAAGGTISNPKGVPFTVTLPHKGDVYNAMGLVDASSKVGYDLTGTKISTDCSKKIAVFGGNARTLINTTACNGNSSGSDNLIQQMFPKVAWGTKYLSVPTKNMQFNTFRVSVEDTTTKVKVNGFPIFTYGGMVNAIKGVSWNSSGTFYEFAANIPLNITGDKPISVTQFIMPGGSCGGASVGNDGTGDPEMILLSPIQQAINNATVFCPGFKDGSSGGTYINVIIPSSGVNSFTIDGKTTTATVDTGSSSYATPYGTLNSTLYKAFVVHIGDTSYRYAKFHVSYPAPHTLASTVPFNAIAYGESQGESWGYNAGTAVKNLVDTPHCFGPCIISGNNIVTCVNNPVTMQIGLPYPAYQVDSLVWSDGTNNFIIPFSNTTTGPIDPKGYAKYDSVIVQNGDTLFYIYSCPIKYTFSSAGIFDITATAMGKFASDCPGVSINHLYVQVGNDVPAFTAIPAGCGKTIVTFTDGSSAIAGSYITKWQWHFGDVNGTGSDYVSTDSTKPNPLPYNYPGLNQYTAVLTTTNSYGCVASDSLVINLAFSLTSKFGKDRDSMCPGSTVNFSDSSSTNAATWNWHFGEPVSGANDSSHLQNPSHTYTTPGMHIITLQVFSSAGCPGNIFKDTIYVIPLPKPNFTFGGVCLPGSTVFTNTSDTAIGIKPYTYLWNFGDGNTSTATNGVNTYSNPPVGGYIVKLTATNAFGCVDSISQTVSTIYGKPTAAFSVVKSDICLGDMANVLDNNQSTATNQTITQWHWTFGSPNDTTTSVHNATHFYNTVGTYNVKLVVVTDKGCMSDSSAAQTVKVNAIPTASFVVPGSCLTSGAVTFTDQSTITPDDGTNQPFTRNWIYAPGATGTTQNGTYTYLNPGTYNVSETVTTAHGCSNSITQPFVIAGTKPRPYFYVNHKDSLCNGIAVTITDTSRIDVGTIGRVDIVWDVVSNPNTVVTVANPGNGKAGTSTNYTHTYTAGTYTIKLIAYAGTTTGCEDSVISTIPITVYPQPTAAFVVPGSCLSSGPATFTDQSSITPDDGTNTPFTYNWVYAPPPATTGTTATGSYQYSAVGTYNVTQTVTSKHGCTNSLTQPFVIAGSKPRPYFYVNHKDSLCNGFAVTITDTSRIDIGTIGRVDVQWDLNSPATTVTNPGSGKPGASTNYTHTYTTGTYYIKLIAYAGTTAGCDDSVTLITPITIYPQPTPGFSLPSSCLTGGAAVFNDLSTITPDDGTNTPFTYNWVYAPPPATTGTTANGSYQYTAVGTYNVTQTVTSQHGCTASLTQPFDVAGSEPRPLYSVKNINNLCSNLPVTLMDSSRLTVGVIKKVEIYWDYQGQSIPDVTDNNPSSGIANTGKSYSYSYPVLGSDKGYAIKIVVYSGATCSHDTTINITVHGSPKLFATSMLDVCLNALPVTINEASDANGLPGTFTYTCPMAPLAIVGGNTFDPTKSNGPVTDTIVATYTTTFGCLDAIKIPIRVLGLPLAHPIASYPLCEKRAITFSDTSNGLGGTINSVQWIINGIPVSGSPYTYYYPTSVNDIVKLVVKTTIGCSSDTAKLGIFINPLPQVDFKFDSSVCLPNGTTQFTDLTTLPGTVQPVFTYNWDFGSGSGANPRYAFVADPTHNFPVIADYNITLKVTSSVGCDSSLTKTLLSTQIHPAPVASFTTIPVKAQVCLGDSILFTDNSTGPVVKSIWYFGDRNIDTANSIYHTYTTATNYTAMHAVIDNHNCISVNNPIIQVVIDALPRVDAGYDKYVVIGDSVVLNEVSVVATNFTSWWTSSPYNPYLNDTTILNPVFKPTDAGTFTETLHVITKAGCSGTSSVNLIALNPPVIPNVFSPNGDGVHDRWEIGYLNKFPGATVKVFNRYGQLIYNVIGYAVPWDGTVNGSPLPIGTYYYIISPKNGVKDLIGSVTIIR